MSYKVIKRYKSHFITVFTGEKCSSYKVINNNIKDSIAISSIRCSYNFITRVLKQRRNALYFPLYNFFITYNGNKKEEKI